MINAETRAVVLFGYPVHHSFSPALQNAAFQIRRLNYVYLAVPVPPARLEGAVAAVAFLDLLGANVTAPHKESVLSFLDEITPESQLLGAVNTIVNNDGRLIGHNTDGSGFLRAVRETGFDPGGETVVILGAGGAARAVVAALARCGVRELIIFNRTLARAEGLAALVRKQGVTATACNWDELETAGPRARSALARAGLIVQTTSLGMHLPTTDDRRPTTDMPPVPPEWISTNHLVYDLVYNPIETAFLKMARMAGARTANGLGMLLYQGAVAFELWTGEQAPVETMRAALEEVMGVE
jgi:shikimate dehydrogenase